MIEEANMFNDEPAGGKEYILASINVDVIETSDDKAYEGFYFDFEAVSEEGLVYDEWISVVMPDPDLRDCTIYPGADCEGWIVFEVDEDDDEPLMVFERGTDNEMWFELY